jgi:putative Mg2+ transporter-C (MgtC) family protein
MQFINVGMDEVIIKLVLAVVLGAVMGLERSLAGKTAGMRTYTLVSMGSALFVIISELVIAQYAAMGIHNIDPLRVASQVVMGIGFLGAGLIIFQDQKLRGLTTAAGLWVDCGLGMAIGFGFYLLALEVAALTLFTFTILWYFEHYLERRVRSPFENDHDNG